MARLARIDDCPSDHLAQPPRLEPLHGADHPRPRPPTREQAGPADQATEEPRTPEAGNSRAARSTLSAFINQIQANPGGRLNQDQIDGLVSMAELRMDAIDDAATAD